MVKILVRGNWMTMNNCALNQRRLKLIYDYMNTGLILLFKERTIINISLKRWINDEQSFEAPRRAASHIWKLAAASKYLIVRSSCKISSLQCVTSRRCNTVAAVVSDFYIEQHENVRMKKRVKEKEREGRRQRDVATSDE